MASECVLTVLYATAVLQILTVAGQTKTCQGLKAKKIIVPSKPSMLRSNYFTNPIHKITVVIKSSFYSVSAIRFSNLQKKCSKACSWAWSLNMLFTVIGGKFEFQVQDCDME